MGSIRLAMLAACAGFAAGCLSTEQPDTTDYGAAAAESLARSPIVIVEGGETLLDCRDAALAGAYALFECDSVTVYSCAPLSSAVLEYEDGARQRFAELRQQIRTFAARGVHDGKRITAISIDTAPGEDGRAYTALRLEAAADSCGPVSPSG